MSDDQWVRFNNRTQCYETKDGTSVSAELVENAQCLADVLHVSNIREKQRMADRDMPPPEIVEAAEKIGRWFAERNITDWELGPCRARWPT